MKPFSIFTICITIMAIPIAVAKLPCSLKWEDSAMGEVPSSAIPIENKVNKSGIVDNTVFYIGRAYLNDDISKAPVTGRIDQSTGLGYFPFTKNNGQLLPTYQVLTNPHNCTLGWVNTINDDNRELLVKSGETSPDSGYVGQGALQDFIVPGEVVMLNGGEEELNILLVTDKGVVNEGEDYTLLISYNSGLNCEMTNFTFIDENGLQILPELVGIDEISNESGATALQIMRHKTRSLERSVFCSSSFSKRSWGVSISASYSPYPWLTLGIGYSHQRSNEDSQSQCSIYEEEQEHVFTREVEVPPYTAAQACSLIFSIKDVDTRFEAEFSYSAKGTGLEVVNRVLEEDGIIGGVIDEERGVVRVKSQGEFQGSLTINTRFIVIPFHLHDGSGEGGCNTIARKSLELKRIYHERGERLLKGLTNNGSLKDLKTFRKEDEERLLQDIDNIVKNSV